MEEPKKGLRARIRDGNPGVWPIGPGVDITDFWRPGLGRTRYVEAGKRLAKHGYQLQMRGGRIYAFVAQNAADLIARTRPIINRKRTLLKSKQRAKRRAAKQAAKFAEQFNKQYPTKG